jgi:hypothetical protein
LVGCQLTPESCLELIVVISLLKFLNFIKKLNMPTSSTYLFLFFFKFDFNFALHRILTFTLWTILFSKYISNGLQQSISIVLRSVHKSRNFKTINNLKLVNSDLNCWFIVVSILCRLCSILDILLFYFNVAFIT